MSQANMHIESTQEVLLLPRHDFEKTTVGSHQQLLKASRRFI